MFGETLEPYLDELKKYHKLSLHEVAMNYCRGVLKGIWKFKKESSSEYKEWCEDAPDEYFHRVLDEWRKYCASDKHREEIYKFVKSSFPEMV